MATHTITLDEATEADLQRLSAKEGRQASEYAARLLARAVRAARPRPVFDPEMLKSYTAENAAEEEALANSDSAHPRGTTGLRGARVKQGEVWMVDFGDPTGPEQAGIRPAIVLQDDALNQDLITSIVIPLTRKTKRLTIPQRSSFLRAKPA